jgi:hypothetical protein
MEQNRKLEEDEEVLEQTVSVRLSDVPEYLRNSELYRTSVQKMNDKNGALSLPSKCFKIELSIKNCSDLSEVLGTACYWVVDDLPDEVYDFVTANMEAIGEVATQFAGSFRVFATIKHLRKSMPSTWLADSARWVDLQLMKYLRRKGHAWGRECFFAADGGHLECLKFAHEGGCSLSDRDNCACWAALQNGSTECIMYAHKNGCPTDYTIEPKLFLYHKNAECLEYVLHNSVFAGLLEDVHETGHTAIARRSPSCIDKLCQMGWNLANDSIAFALALETHDLATIEHVVRSGCKLRGDPFAELFEVAAYAELQPAIIPEVVALLLERGQRFIIQSLENIAAHEVRREVVRTLIAWGGCPTEPAATVVIARLGCVDLLKSAFEFGCRPSPEVSQVALELADMAMLQCAKAHGCAVPAPAIAAALMVAANEGDVVKLQYLHTLLLSEAAAAAAFRGHEACVQFLEQHQQVNNCSQEEGRCKC